MGAGPTALALDRSGNAVFVWSTFARQLSRLDLTVAPTATLRRAGKALPPTSEAWTLAVPRIIPGDEASLMGRELFMTNGNPLVSEHGRSCASCHIDGRDDGITWQTPPRLRDEARPAIRQDDAASVRDHDRLANRGAQPTERSIFHPVPGGRAVLLREERQRGRQWLRWPGPVWPGPGHV